MSPPLEIVDKNIGSRIHVIMIHNQEFAGTLVGFDEYLNLVLEDVSEYTEAGVRQHKKMLLQSRLIAMLVPGEVENKFNPVDTKFIEA